VRSLWPSRRTWDDDLRRCAAGVAAPEVRQLIDFGQPVGVLMVGVLHFMPDADDPAGIAARSSSLVGAQVS
jgi:hypothetical protein